MRSYDAETILRSLLFDVDRMIVERREPTEVLTLIKRKVAFLENPRWENVRWWNEPTRKKFTNKTSEEEYLDEKDEELMFYG